MVEVINTYDAHNRVVAQTLPTGEQTVFSWKPDFGGVAVTDVTTNTVTDYTYDELGRLTAITDSEGHTAHRAWDDHYHLAGATSRLGATITVERNGWALPERIQQPGQPDAVVVYDAQNRVESSTDASGTTIYTYDGDERIPATVTDALDNTTTVDVVDGLVRSCTTRSVN